MKKDLNLDLERIKKDGVKIYDFDEVKEIVPKMKKDGTPMLDYNGDPKWTIQTKKGVTLLNGDLVYFPVGYGKGKIKSKSQKDMFAITINDIWAKEYKVQSKAFMITWNLFEALTQAKNFKEGDERISKTVVMESKSRSASDQEWNEYLEFKKQKANGTSGK